MTTFGVKIWYRASDEDSPQVHQGLSEAKINLAARAFLNDMTYLKGDGVRKMLVEVEQPSND